MTRLPSAGKLKSWASKLRQARKNFKEADYITVHVPKNEQTLNMINTEQIKMMKPTVRLVNCARGGIINEDALYAALAEKRIAGAALDVFPKEPPENTKFKDFANWPCYASPRRKHRKSANRGSGRSCFKFL